MDNTFDVTMGNYDEKVMRFIGIYVINKITHMINQRKIV